MTRNYDILPKIANWMVEMQMEHSLPIEITIGEKKEEHVNVIFCFDEDDENALHWMFDKCVNRYIKTYG